MADTVPMIFALVLAMIGGAGGLAALLKVSSDNTKSISSAAVDVVDMLQEQMNRNTERIEALEGYASRFDDWSDKVLNLLARTIEALTEPQRSSFREEEQAIAAARPQRRSADGRFLRKDAN